MLDLLLVWWCSLVLEAFSWRKPSPNREVMWMTLAKFVLNCRWLGASFENWNDTWGKRRDKYPYSTESSSFIPSHRDILSTNLDEQHIPAKAVPLYFCVSSIISPDSFPLPGENLFRSSWTELQHVVQAMLLWRWHYHQRCKPSNEPLRGHPDLMCLLSPCSLHVHQIWDWNASIGG